ncbi:carotenoid biosynthesis protein [Oxyplasma meridianum]|uniref:Carotenoid biosynthesis protein n=1 Tax=Oxyplasma meridianum TaxID=3073602 RepID=A0AAX4NFW1_9ARCH
MNKSYRKSIAWYISFSYLGYIFIGQLPLFKNLETFSTFNVSIGLLVVYIISSYLILGGRKSVYFFMIAAVVGSLFELISLNTGIPFGFYRYTNELGPMVGQLPIFIPLLWASLSFYCYIGGKKFLMPFLMVFLDLSFDPRYSGRLWIWISKTQYFGDPVTNFLGWFVTAAVISIIVSIVVKTDNRLDEKAMIFVYLFGLDNCISDVYSKLYVPAMVAASVLTVTFLLYLFRVRIVSSISRKSLSER